MRKYLAMLNLCFVVNHLLSVFKKTICPVLDICRFSKQKLLYVYILLVDNPPCLL